MHQIPVGPVHAGIIEPGHFRFQAVGETVLNLEQHLGYVHKGIEKLAVGRDPMALARLAARISGDSTVAHSWAACQSLERALGAGVPERGAWLRAVMCERERVVNHIEKDLKTGMRTKGVIVADITEIDGRVELKVRTESSEEAKKAA